MLNLNMTFETFNWLMLFKIFIVSKFTFLCSKFYYSLNYKPRIFMCFRLLKVIINQQNGCVNKIYYETKNKELL